MATYFVGSSYDAFTVTPTGTFDEGSNIRITDGHADAYVTSPVTGLYTPVTRLWTHGVVSSDDYGTAGVTPYVWLNAAGVAVVRLVAVDGYVWGLQFWNGSGWVQPGESVFAQQGTYDFFIESHATNGRLTWCVDGNLASDAGGLDTSAIGSIARLRLGPYENYIGSGRHSSVILASYNTLGHTVTRRAPIANGTFAEWTGAYSAIDDVTNNDADAVTTSTTGQVSTFTIDGLAPLAEGTVVKCVAVAARLRNDGGAVPTHARAILRVGGTNYQAAANMDTSSGYRGAVSCFDTNPATGLDWDASAVNGGFGLLSTD